MLSNVLLVRHKHTKDYTESGLELPRLGKTKAVPGTHIKVERSESFASFTPRVFITETGCGGKEKYFRGQPKDRQA